MATKKTTSKKRTSSNKTNAKRVVNATKKYNKDGGVRNNVSAIAGIAAASATSASRSKSKGAKVFYTILCIALIAALVYAAYYGYTHGWFDQTPGGGGNLPVNNADYKVEVIANEQLSIHFLELGNGYTGDSVYVKAGQTDILIDAGSRQNSATAIANYVDQYCTDGVLEYVVVTHAHQDHIAGFVGTTSAQGIFEKYDCKNIIQFSRTDATTAIYNKYCQKRDAAQADGANVYTALDCINNANGAQKTYDLTADGSITMEILYQKYYEQPTNNENNYSVCLTINQGENHYLFTGDLEGEGEESLVESNPNLPQMKLYKGGHHGSYTAASNALLEKIRPQYVCICCCAGSVEYTQNTNNTFPAQAFIDRIATYTDAVYATTVGKIKYDEEKQKYVDEGFTSLNGSIVFACSNGTITMYFTNNSLKLKDTDWFKQNRTCPQAWQLDGGK